MMMTVVVVARVMAISVVVMAHLHVALFDATSCLTIGPLSSR
jgi:hypothetical protein